jgi:hypothetical protein
MKNQLKMSLVTPIGKRGEEESKAEEGQGAENTKVRLVMCLLEKTSQRFITNAFERHIKRLRVFWGNGDQGFLSLERYRGAPFR